MEWEATSVREKKLADKHEDKWNIEIQLEVIVDLAVLPDRIPGRGLVRDETKGKGKVDPL